MAMKKEKIRSIYEIIILFSFLITISISPWVNKDSMIIPKLIILFVLALYLLPKIVYALPDILQFSKLKVLVGIITLIIIQIIIVTIVSIAPFEQQLFGRTGRGLGIVTSVSLLLVVLGLSLIHI